MSDSESNILNFLSTTERNLSTTERNQGKTATARKVRHALVEYFVTDSNGTLHDRFIDDPSRARKETDWSRLKDQTCGEVAHKWRDYSPATFGVMLYLMSTTGWGGFIPIKQSEIAKELGMSPGSASKAIAALLKDRVLLAVDDPRMPGGKAFKMNANFLYKGRDVLWNSARKRDGDICK